MLGAKRCSLGSGTPALWPALFGDPGKLSGRQTNGLAVRPRRHAQDRGRANTELMVTQDGLFSTSFTQKNFFVPQLCRCPAADLSNLPLKRIHPAPLLCTREPGSGGWYLAWSVEKILGFLCKSHRSSWSLRTHCEVDEISVFTLWKRLARLIEISIPIL